MRGEGVVLGSASAATTWTPSAHLSQVVFGHTGQAQQLRCRGTVQQTPCVAAATKQMLIVVHLRGARAPHGGQRRQRRQARVEHNDNVQQQLTVDPGTYPGRYLGRGAEREPSAQTMVVVETSVVCVVHTQPQART